MFSHSLPSSPNPDRKGELTQFWTTMIYDGADACSAGSFSLGGLGNLLADQRDLLVAQSFFA